jgi:tetratricopeptide (TPR) repeat protein
LDTLVTTGIVGLLSYLAIFASAFYGLLKICFNPLKSKSPQANNGREEKENLLPALGMAVLLIVYFLQNLLVFDMISSYTVFFLSLGFIGFLTHANSPTSLRPSDSARVGERTNANFFGAVILVLTLFLLYFGNIQPAKSAINTVKMIVPQYNLEQSINFYEKALNTFMEKYEIREQFAQRVYYAGFGGKEKPEVLKNAFDLAEKEMEKSIEKNPLDFRSHLFFGKVYFSDYYSFRDVQKLNLAENIFLKAIELSPTNQQGYWHLGEVKMAQGKTEEGISLFQKAIDLEPRLGMSHWYLAIAYKNSGQLEKARQEIEEAERLGYNFKENLGELERAIEVYQALKDDKKLVLLYQEAIKIQPNNYQFWANLAASYANLGEFEKAKEAALKVKELKPDLAPRVEEFLKSLK